MKRSEGDSTRRTEAVGDSHIIVHMQWNNSIKIRDLINKR